MFKNRVGFRRWIYGFIFGLACTIALFIPIFNQKSGLDVVSEFLVGSKDKNLVSLSGTFNNTPNLGWEFVDNGTVIHVWNKYDSYYFNASNGIQFSNHYDEYWTQNVLMLGYLTDGDISDPSDWNLIYRTDEISGFNKQFNGSTDSFMNLTLYKNLSYAGYDFRLAIRYHLKPDDRNLTIVPYIKNLGDPIPFTLGFGWEMKNIQIGNNYKHNYFRHEAGSDSSNITSYSLNSDLDEFYTNLTYNYTSDECNGAMEWDDELGYWFCNGTEYKEWNTIQNRVFYLDYWLNNETPSKTLYLSWGVPVGWYAVQVKSRDGQYNAPTTLFLKIGSLSSGQEKQTILFWYDADITWSNAQEFDAGGASFGVMQTEVCRMGDNQGVIAYCDYNDGSAGKVIAFTVLGSEVTFGSEVEFCSDVLSTWQWRFDVTPCNTGSNTFAVAYTNDSADDDGYISVGTVTWADRSIVMDDANKLEFNADGDTEEVSCVQIDTDLIAITYNEEQGSDNDGWVAVVSVSGTTPTLKDAKLSVALWSRYHDLARLGDLGDNKFIVAHGIWESPYYKNISHVVYHYHTGNETITYGNYGDGIVPKVGDTQGHEIETFEDDKFLTVYYNASDGGIGVTAGTISDYDITYCTPLELGVVGAGRAQGCVNINETQWVVIYEAGVVWGDGWSQVINVSWTGMTITAGTAEKFHSGYVGGNTDLGLGACNLTDYSTSDNNTHLIVVYQDQGDTDDGDARVGNLTNWAYEEAVEPEQDWHTNHSFNFSFGNLSTQSWTDEHRFNFSFGNLSTQSWSSEHIFNFSFGNLSTQSWTPEHRFNFSFGNLTSQDWDTKHIFNFSFGNLSSQSWTPEHRFNFSFANLSTQSWFTEHRFNFSFGNLSTQSWTPEHRFNFSFGNLTSQDWNTQHRFNFSFGNLTSKTYNDKHVFNFSFGNLSTQSWSSEHIFNFSFGNLTSQSWSTDHIFNFSFGNLSTQDWSTEHIFNFSFANLTSKDWNTEHIFNFSFGNLTSQDWDTKHIFNFSFSNTSEQQWTTNHSFNFSFANLTSQDWTTEHIFNFSFGNLSTQSWTTDHTFNFSFGNLTSQSWNTEHTFNFSFGNLTSQDYNTKHIFNFSFRNTSKTYNTKHTFNFSFMNTTVPAAITITNEFPTNQSTDITLQPTMYITISSSNGSTMDIQWYTGNSSTNCTTPLSTTNNVANGTHHYVNYYSASTHATTYYWRVQVDDENTYENETYHFTTIGNITIINNRDYTFALAGVIGIIGVAFAFIGINRRRKKKNNGGY